MSSIYIHIPFCASRCIYCGFYSTTLPELQDAYTDAVCKELRQRQDYISSPVRTIYLGGGTPSQLSAENLSKIFETVGNLYGSFSNMEEITMECNPDDITEDFCKVLTTLPVNRVSMGIQSFSDKRLKFLHRRHTSEEAVFAVQRLRAAGISNISIDLMFGFPEETLFEWEEDLWMALALNPQHISAYSLMYEEGTALRHLLDKGKIKEIDEELSVAMYNRLVDLLTEAGYEHYEISNFARSGFRSIHNSSYWNETEYLGVGAAAHSYNKASRQWNISDAEEYIRRIRCGETTFEKEELDLHTRYDDLITTALRTHEGIDLDKMKAEYGEKLYKYLLDNAQPRIDSGDMRKENRRLSLTRKGLYISDDVMSDLIYDD